MKLSIEEIVKMTETFERDAKRIVIVQHDGEFARYLFEVPDGVHLAPGDTVVCDTRKGEANAVCVTHSIVCGENAFEAFVKLTGATLPLRKIVGKYEVNRFVEEN